MLRWNNRNQTDHTEPGTTGAPTAEEQQHAINKWKQHAKILSDKCGRLEAQNVLIPVQQLDLMAQGMAMGLAFLSMLVYWRLLGVCVGLLMREEGFFVKMLALPVWEDLKEKMLLALVQVNGSDFLLPVWNTACSCVLQMKTLILLIDSEAPSRWIWIFVKWVLFLTPIRLQYRAGLAYRRFQVFAIFFIVLARIRLCRSREALFLKKVPIADETPTSAASSSAQDEVDDSFEVPTYGSSIAEDDIWEANYEISARFLYVSILRLQGLWTKTAQFLSSRADFMPAAYVRELSLLQDSAQVTPWDQVTIPPWIISSLTQLDTTPLASASIGQVHTALWTNNDGKSLPVVVKVQHPHARPLLTDDFRSLHLLCRIVRWLEPEYGFVEVLVREWAKEAKHELDFQREAENLRKAAKSIERWEDHDAKSNGVLYTNAHGEGSQRVPFRVEVPRPIVATRTVLVMTFSEGVRVDNMEQVINRWDLSPIAVMDSVAQTFAHLMYVCPPFNGDPHPGNLFIRPGITSKSSSSILSMGFTLVLLDWGLSKQMEDIKRKSFCQMTLAAATFDYGLLLDAWETIGMKLKRENTAEDMESMRYVLRDITPSKVSRKRMKAKMRTDRKRMESKEKGNRVPMDSKSYPGEWFFFIRGSKFGIHLSFLDVVRPFAKRGLCTFLTDELKLLPLPPTHQQGENETLSLKVRETLCRLRDIGELVGGQVCVLNKDGKTLVHEVVGSSGSLVNNTPMRPDSLVLGYSCTKAITASIAHVMVAEGYLSLDEPFCERVWQSFCPSEHPPQHLAAAMNITMDVLKARWSWKRRVTLRHVLTHGAGFWSALPTQLTVQMMASCEKCSAAFEYHEGASENTLLPTSEPGVETQYHFLSFGWLVAGALTGAYSAKHGLCSKDVTFEMVYNAVLLPKLSAKTISSGFSPCGRRGDLPLAMTQVDGFDLTKILQKDREMEAQGEGGALQEGFRQIREQFRGKEFLLDQRIWNCGIAQTANCPAAGGRFTAEGLANFYHDLGSRRILDETCLTQATRRVEGEFISSALQGQTNILDADANQSKGLALGYQLMSFSKEQQAFGHAGVGGSIGFYHPSGVSVAVMLNKADAPPGTAATIVRLISSSFEW